MIRDEKIWIANDPQGEPISMVPKMANRHGLVAGATGTGKTVTLKVMAETFSEMGIPVFIADVKGDVSSLMDPGVMTDDMASRIERFGLAPFGFEFTGFPVTLWDIYGRRGIQLRTTVSEIGPLLLSRILGLNNLQSDILSVVFKIADDNDLLLVDIKDLKSMLNFVNENSDEFTAQYGKISSASVGVIIRALVSLESEGGDIFFGEPALRINDFFNVEGGKGVINILDSSSLINNPRLYSTFLLWLICELFENLPEVGDKVKPRMVFFFDEAHLLFNDAPKLLLEKIEQMVKLIRSKGVGIFFCTQNPKDIPDGVLSQLGNKVQHGLRAYTPNDQKGLKAAASSFRENPDLNTYETIQTLGTGEAVISFLQEDGVPGMVQKAFVLPPRSSFKVPSEDRYDSKVKESPLWMKYHEAYDPDSAYEFLERRGAQLQEEAEKAAKEQEEQKRLEAEEKEKQKQQEKEEKEKAKAKEKEEAARKKKGSRLAKTVGNSVTGTVGRELGKQLGSSFGSFGKKLGGNLGASLGRGLFSTFFRK